MAPLHDIVDATARFPGVGVGVGVDVGVAVAVAVGVGAGVGVGVGVGLATIDEATTTVTGVLLTAVEYSVTVAVVDAKPLAGNNE